MSHALFAAVAQSNIEKLKVAIQELHKNNIDINNEIFSGKTILDIAIETAGDNLENSSSKKIIGILKKEGAITFLEKSKLPNNENENENKENIWGESNFSLGNNHGIPVPLAPPPPKPPLHPPLPKDVKPTISKGIAIPTTKGGRKTKKLKKSKKSRKSRKHLRR